MSKGNSKYWCFTLNNYSDEEEAGIASILDKVNYMVYGREVGECGTRHLQGYMELVNKSRLSGVKKLECLSRSHFEVRRGTSHEASTYCKKDGDVFEYGEISKGQGARNDLDTVKRHIEEGKSELEIADLHFGSWCRYRGSFEAYRSLKKAKTSRDVKVTYLWGNAGTGKTRGVFETYSDVWISSDPTLQWFDGYNGEDVVLLDDYRGEANDALILRILDRYPTQVAVKGSFRSWCPTRIFISSNMKYDEMHLGIQDSFRRRIHDTFHLEGNLYSAGNEKNLARFLELIKK